MNYYERVERAIEFIESNLQYPLRLEQISDEAFLSKYHFHRVFASIVGETVGDYIRKRRLTEASCLLVTTNKKIIEIALDFQFESQQSFSRSFKNHFGITPGKYRKNSLSRFMFERKKITNQKLKHLGGISMKPVIKEINEIKIIGMEKTTTLQTSYIDIPKLWEAFCKRMCEINNIKNAKVFYEARKPDLNFDMNDFTETTEFTEIAGLEVDEVKDIPEGMVNITVPAGKYAVFTHKGFAKDLRQTYEYIWGTWLPNSNYEADLKYDFELYGERFRGADNKESEIDIYIPIK